ncbi:hypothetical protein [Haloplanus sp. C73]|uniref:hypothetical protein n=1 Tax=Haloplanus sp. C73 TaxID=3421641 RepID=UPI003EB97105
MQHRALTLIVATLLAFGAGGVVASHPPNPSATTAQSPADTASPATHTVDVVDPRDRLSEQDVETAWRLAWANETVRSYIDGDGPAHFQVEAVGDELQVYVAPNGTTEPRVQAVVNLDSKSVVDVTSLTNVITADELHERQLLSANLTVVDDGASVSGVAPRNVSPPFPRRVRERTARKSAA